MGDLSGTCRASFSVYRDLLARDALRAERGKIKVELKRTASFLAGCLSAILRHMFKREHQEPIGFCAGHLLLITQAAQ